MATTKKKTRYWEAVQYIDSHSTRTTQGIYGSALCTPATLVRRREKANGVKFHFKSRVAALGQRPLPEGKKSSEYRSVAHNGKRYILEVYQES